MKRANRRQSRGRASTAPRRSRPERGRKWMRVLARLGTAATVLSLVALGAAIGAAGLAGRARPVDVIGRRPARSIDLPRPWAIEEVADWLAFLVDQLEDETTR